MHNRGITLGCTANQYCPADGVRRDQMAAFMFRLGNVVHQQGGNAFGATAVIGTTDAHALDVRANGERVMRFEPNTISPNVIGGSPANNVAPGVRGATIAGGGVPGVNVDSEFDTGIRNRVTDSYGAIAGGHGNLAGDDAGDATDAGLAFVGGGGGNHATGFASVVTGGGVNRASGSHSAIGGGNSNEAAGLFAAVGGGAANTVTGDFATVPGGGANAAHGNYSLA
ncbi:MAG: hypothetical protein KJ018_13690, partial [Burkholderiales bacterium]|nr:hypothetical protein [Burkholderiales bacterium]